MVGATYWHCGLEQATSLVILPSENVGIGQVIAEDGFTPSLECFRSSPNDPGFPGRLSSGHTSQDQGHEYIDQNHTQKSPNQRIDRLE